MKYQQPYGVSDPDAPYVNGDPSRGVQGSIPPAAAFEQPQRELVGVIEKSGFVTSDTNLLQMAYAVRSQRMNYAIDSNPNVAGASPNNITVTYDPPITQYHAGLTLHVRVKYTNVPGQVTIDAGAGRVPIRKMNNADVAEGELPINCIATLIFDGTAFQLSNFSGGGTGGTETRITVNIPFAVEQPPFAPGTIRVQFNPALDQTPVAGDIIAVQTMQTQPGPTSLMIDNFPNPVPCLPNGGGDMLQGDIVAGDIVQFFFDGNALRFIPNPEISAPVTYFVGPSQQYLTVADAMAALKRKVIGQGGYVTLQLTPTRFDGPIDVAHPSGDRLCIQGTLLNQTPVIWSDFAIVGNTPPLREQARLANNGTMRTRFGTEITVNDPGMGGWAYGIRNNGAGRVLFKDLFICGPGNTAPPPLGPGGQWWTVGVQVEPGLGVTLQNVTVSSVHVGVSVVGAASANGAFAYGCSHCGFSISGLLSSSNGGAFGVTNHGYLTIYGATSTYGDYAIGNGAEGVWATSAGGHQFWYGGANNNGTWDVQASDSASVVLVDPTNIANNRLNPPLNVPGNNNGTISRTQVYRPPP